MREEITLTKKETEAIVDHLEELPMSKVKNLVAFFNSKLQEPMPTEELTEGESAEDNFGVDRQGK